MIPTVSATDDPPAVLSLSDTINMALDANLNLKQSQDEVRAATENRKASITQFFPTLSASYDYVHRNREQTQELTGLGPSPDFIVRPDDEYTFVTSFNQPIFRGFSLINQFRIADLDLDAAEFSEKITRQDVILDAKNAFYSVLKTLKLLEVAKQRVSQIAAQKEVAENFYEVGMSPLNDLLESQASLANARQDEIVALNDLAIAKSQFNTLLRRQVSAPVELQDVLDYSPFIYDFQYCLDTANENRLEITVADLDVEIAQKELNLAKKDYMPSVNLRGEYVRVGDDWQSSGGEGISDAKSWNIRATAEWDFWEWGRTHFGVREKLHRLSQAQYRREQILDNIELEVKTAFLRTRESEKNILTVEKAIEQAKENFRINQERFKEQVATTTDVLDAQTLLSDTLTNYFNALYNFKIAKATLYRAMGQEVLE
ncbi:MAG: TolC family protein [Desulfobacterales bacterium]|jgi:outer membrane protein|nr:TolC family protein [Deltaproteobacteria bacterium]